MVSMDNLNPNGQAAKQMKTHIDKEILQDLTLHTRQQLNCWIQLTVKSGHNPTDITCDVPWPHLDNSKEIQNTAYPNEVLNLGKPRITLTRKQDMRKPNLNHRITFEDNYMKIWNLSQGNNSSQNKLCAEIGLRRAQTILDCYTGTLDTFAKDIMCTLRSTLHRPNFQTTLESKLKWALARNTRMASRHPTNQNMCLH